MITAIIRVIVLALLLYLATYIVCVFLSYLPILKEASSVHHVSSVYLF